MTQIKYCIHCDKDTEQEIYQETDFPDYGDPVTYEWSECYVCGNSNDC